MLTDLGPLDPPSFLRVLVSIVTTSKVVRKVTETMKENGHRQPGSIRPREKAPLAREEGEASRVRCSVPCPGPWADGLWQLAAREHHMKMTMMGVEWEGWLGETFFFF